MREVRRNGTLGGRVEKKEEDELNWFGEKLGSEKTANGVGGGVGKYLQLSSSTSASKRPASAVATPTDVLDEGKKKRKVGFGDFEGW